jgi:arginyl-tRNA synthetase
VVLELEKRLADRLRAVLKEKYELEIGSIPLETPPELRLGEIATPIAFELARKLRKAPKIIAQEIVAALGPLRGFAKFEVAGAGYINAFSIALRPRCDEWSPPTTHIRHRRSGHALVEHTSINPNKAAHIGHLRNAILGDTFVRLLRAAGYKVDVQNYIDNTGVQVADVVVGFLHLEKKSLPKFTRARSSLSSPERRAHRLLLLGSLRAHLAVVRRRESTNRRRASRAQEIAPRHAARDRARRQRNRRIADLISTAVLRRHLETMLRLGIEYDFLPRESEILHLKFWEAAFEKLKQSGVLYFENEGKNKGCWVMTRGPEIRSPTKGPTKDAKVIVRSNGTVTYVGKDIAYHLWKFGLLGKDFGYKRFFSIPITSAGSRRSKGRAMRIRTSAARRHLQRHRLAPERSAGQRDPGAARHGLHRAGRPLHALQLRDGGADAALRRGAWLRHFR